MENFAVSFKAVFNYKITFNHTRKRKTKHTWYIIYPHCQIFKIIFHQNYVFNCVDIAFLVSWKSPLLDSCISSNQQKRLAPGFTWAGAEAGSRVSGLTSREPDLREGQDIWWRGQFKIYRGEHETWGHFNSCDYNQCWPRSQCSPGHSPVYRGPRPRPCGGAKGTGPSQQSTSPASQDPKIIDYHIL